MGGSCGWFPLSHKEILEWVEAHEDALPRTLAELSTYPVPFRRVIVNRVSPERRTQFWCDHLRTFLGAQTRLNAEQCAFVEQTIDQLPSIFGKPLADARVQMKALEDRMRDLFTREQAAAMFAHGRSAGTSGGTSVASGHTFLGAGLGPVRLSSWRQLPQIQ